MPELQSQAETIVLDACREHNETADVARRIDVEQGPTAPLYGGDDGVLDSIGLVSLVLAVEQRIEDDLGVTVTLADERAASRSRSPFRTVESLGALIVERVHEEAGGAPA